MSPGYRRPGADSNNSLAMASDSCDIIDVARCDDRKDRDMETLIATLIAALNQHIDARIKAVLADHGPEVDMDKLRELVKPLVDSEVEQALYDHNQEYDHDSYDSAVNKLDDLPDLDNLEDSVKDAIRDLTFEVSVS